MPHKDSRDKPVSFELDSLNIHTDYLADLQNDRENISNDTLDAADGMKSSNSMRSSVKGINRSSSSWQRIEALNESRRLRALLKEFYED